MKNSSKKPIKPKNVIIAVILMPLLFTGYLYIGKIWRFVILWILFLFLRPAVGLTFGDQNGSYFTGALVLLAMVDGYFLTKKYNEKLSNNLIETKKAG